MGIEAFKEGLVGEFNAAEYLRGKGYHIYKANYKSHFGEIDLIAQKGEYIVFVEVKSRASIAYGMPSEAVGKSKRRKIVLTALDFMQRNNLMDAFVRFDIIEIVGDKINHIENAFDASEFDFG